MVPPLDERGLLPPGVHDADDWLVVERMFATNDHRRALLDQMRIFIAAELQHVAAGLDLIIGGSYLTTKVVPGDIDCTVVIPVDEIQARVAALQLLVVDGRKGRIWHQYRVEAYPTLGQPGAHDFREFFQYVGEKSAVLHNCAARDLRGVIRVASWLPG